MRLEDWNRLNDTFLGITGYYFDDVSELSGALPERMRRVFVAPRFFDVLGVEPALGRVFSSPEERFGGPNAALISQRLWQRRFGESHEAVGGSLRIGKSSYEIVGVMPPDFVFPSRDVDLWTPSPPDAPYAQSREATWFTGIGRLRPGISPDAAERAAATGAGLFGLLSVMLAALGLYGIVSCWVSQRRREFGVRLALGATPGAIAGLVLRQAAWLAGAGVAVGLGLAALLSRAVAGLLFGVSPLDPVSFAATGLLLASVTLAATWLPARRAARMDPVIALRTE